MTRESLNKHWEVIDAWRKGAEVEYLAFKWEKIEEFFKCIGNSIYRYVNFIILA